MTKFKSAAIFVDAVMNIIMGWLASWETLESGVVQMGLIMHAFLSVHV